MLSGIVSWPSLYKKKSVKQKCQILFKEMIARWYSVLKKR